MQHSDVRQAYRNMVTTVREKLEQLPKECRVRTIFTNKMLQEIIHEIEIKNIDEFRGSTWPPLFCFVESQSISVIQAFQSDIDLVIKHSGGKKIDEIIRFLSVKKGREDRYWVAGLFEIFIMSRFLKENEISAKIDHSLPNGRNVDVAAEINGKQFCFECTVITESEEDRNVWDKYMKAVRRDPNVSLVRPGNFDGPDYRSPSPYYDCVRFYDKVYDKLAKDLDPAKDQMCESSPNVLLVSIHSPRAHLSATGQGVGWALDELFIDQPRNRTASRSSTNDSIDTSLVGWLNFKVKYLNKTSHFDMVKFNQVSNDLINAPRKIGGILLFDDCTLKKARVNYSAKEECKLSHNEMSIIENILKEPPMYCRQS